MQRQRDETDKWDRYDMVITVDGKYYHLNWRIAHTDAANRTDAYLIKDTVRHKVLEGLTLSMDLRGNDIEIYDQMFNWICDIFGGYDLVILK